MKLRIHMLRLIKQTNQQQRTENTNPSREKLRRLKITRTRRRAVPRTTRLNGGLGKASDTDNRTYLVASNMICSPQSYIEQHRKLHIEHTLDKTTTTKKNTHIVRCSNRLSFIRFVYPTSYLSKVDTFAQNISFSNSIPSPNRFFV